MARANLELNMLGFSYMKQRSLDNSRTECNGEVTFKGLRYGNIKIWRGSAFSQAVKDITDEMESHWDDDNRINNDNGSLTPSSLFLQYFPSY
jgi:hypothetical protein